MDALKFLEECARMCNSIKECSSCPAYGKNCYITSVLDSRDKEPLVLAVEKWSKEHPIKTRQSEFLKMFPDVKIQHDVIDIGPCILDKKIKDSCGRNGTCFDCRKKYWLEEVE